MKDPIRCERFTKSGKPCRAILDMTQVACRLHATEHDRILGARWQQIFRDGYDAGLETGRREWHEVLADLPEQPCQHFRMTDAHGNQIVAVNGRYAYTWSGQDRLVPGDRVIVPGNWLYPKPSEGVVTGLGSDYQGELSTIIRKITDLEHAK